MEPKREESETKSAKAPKPQKGIEARAALLRVLEKGALAFVAGIGTAVGNHALSALSRRPGAEVIPLRRAN